MSSEEKTTSQVSDSAANEEGEEVTKRVVEKRAISETENEGEKKERESEQSEEANGGETGAGSVMVKRRRGRPSKIIPDGRQLVPVRSPPAGCLTSPFHNSLKRGRGRPRGSGYLQFLASLGGIAEGTPGGNFTPHVLNLQIGEDIVSKVSLFSLIGPRAVCILSASGVVSTVILRQPSSPSSILRYEGRFEILTISGSYLFSGYEGRHWKRGELSASLAKPDGSVFGGEIAGPMIAASPVQLILGSFKQNTSKDIKRWYTSSFLMKQSELTRRNRVAEKRDGIGEVSSQAAAVAGNGISL